VYVRSKRGPHLLLVSSLGMTTPGHDLDRYRQRAPTGGLIISEASQVSPTGQGYPTTPGIHSAAQVAAWKKVVEQVHARGGKIILQLWHVRAAQK